MNECRLTPEEMEYVAYPKDSIVLWCEATGRYNIVFPWHPDYADLSNEVER